MAMTETNPVCKCCGGATTLFAEYDFSRSCEDHKGPVFAKSGISVSYYRCTSCGFIFTSHFDNWSGNDFAERIYNSDYIRVDPEFDSTRPRYMAGELEKMLGPFKAGISLLDYGGGRGKMIEELGGRGFGKLDCFDPYFSSGAKPSAKFDLVTAFEVVEHSPNPMASFEDALSYVAPKGALLFSTFILGRRPDPKFWYIAPRNGHISIHSWESLQRLASRLKVKCLSLDDNMHLFFRDPESDLVRHIAAKDPGAILYAASRRGLGAFAQTAGLFAELGRPLGSRYLRHWGRAMLCSSGVL